MNIIANQTTGYKATGELLTRNFRSRRDKKEPAISTLEYAAFYSYDHGVLPFVNNYDMKELYVIVPRLHADYLELDGEVVAVVNIWDKHIERDGFGPFTERGGSNPNPPHGGGDKLDLKSGDLYKLSPRITEVLEGWPVFVPKVQVLNGPDKFVNKVLPLLIPVQWIVKNDDRYPFYKRFLIDEGENLNFHILEWEAPDPENPEVLKTYAAAYDPQYTM